MGRAYWVLKHTDDSGLYLADDGYGVAFTTSRKDATRFSGRAKARRARRGLAEWSIAVVHVTRRKRSAPLADARRTQVEGALDALRELTITVGAVRGCLTAPTPGFPLYTSDIMTAALTLARCAAAHNALVSAEVGK